MCVVVVHKGAGHGHVQRYHDGALLGCTADPIQRLEEQLPTRVPENWGGGAGRVGRLAADVSAVPHDLATPIRDVPRKFRRALGTLGWD